MRTRPSGGRGCRRWVQWEAGGRRAWRPSPVELRLGRVLVAGASGLPDLRGDHLGVPRSLVERDGRRRRMRPSALGFMQLVHPLEHVHGRQLLVDPRLSATSPLSPSASPLFAAASRRSASRHAASEASIVCCRPTMSSAQLSGLGSEGTGRMPAVQLRPEGAVREPTTRCGEISTNNRREPIREGCDGVPRSQG
jgi:hypothetical protein